MKLSWNTKIFKVLKPQLMETIAAVPSLESPTRNPNPALPLSPPCSPPVAVTPRSRAPSRRALPTPDPMVMNRAATAVDGACRGSVSAGKMMIMAAESMHSASKLSASKCLSAKRRAGITRTPGVRKKLELSGSECVFRERGGPSRQCALHSAAVLGGSSEVQGIYESQDFFC